MLDLGEPVNAKFLTVSKQLYKNLQKSPYYFANQRDYGNNIATSIHHS